MGIWSLRPTLRRRLRHGLDAATTFVRANCPDSTRTRLRTALAKQEALRRVAMLVAHGTTPPSETFWVVCRELGGLLDADYAAIARFEPERMMCHLAEWNDPSVPAMGVPFGGRWPMGDTAAAAVYETGRSARRASGSTAGELGEWLRSHGVSQVVSCPVIVHNRLWGELALRFLGSRPAPADTERRMGDFVELVACTIAQAEYRAELIASRARLVTAADAAQRRIERDLHDGAQQRLIALGLYLREAETNASDENEALRRSLSSAAKCQSDVVAQIQQISCGIYPTTLTQMGLKGAIKSLVRHCPVRTDLHIRIDRRLPEPAEITVYYVVSEVLANVLKHANASVVHIDLVATSGDDLRLTIRDDGVGGADLRRGTGLIGLQDRVDTVGGTMEVSSPVGGGTSVVVGIPSSALDDPQGRP
ncbi:GAF domain-containing sensor histidine kinase [Actinoallomurus bryophytorum]|uniref:GAF domain-containing sensor histidine kinase n=1 Tax=Actinoallomurus bryophytorum TaxID=1490222 RepID=UPI001639C55C|nr:GAF domain-containing sensor histidine kinase [Actinoallomurus bryophytorum]